MGIAEFRERNKLRDSLQQAVTRKSIWWRHVNNNRQVGRVVGVSWRGSDLLETRRSNAGFLTLTARDGARRRLPSAPPRAFRARGHREIGGKTRRSKRETDREPESPDREVAIFKDRPSVEFF